MKEGAVLVAGFIAGALVGFAWAQSTKAGMADHVKTTTQDGKLFIEVDAGAAASQGLTDLLGGKW